MRSARHGEPKPHEIYAGGGEDLDLRRVGDPAHLQAAFLTGLAQHAVGVASGGGGHWPSLHSGGPGPRKRRRMRMSRASSPPRFCWPPALDSLFVLTPAERG